VLDVDQGAAQLRLCNYLKSERVLSLFQEWRQTRELDASIVVRSETVRLEALEKNGFDMSALLMDAGENLNPFVRCEYALMHLEDPEPVIEKFKYAVDFLMNGCSIYLKFCPALCRRMGVHP